MRRARTTCRYVSLRSHYFDRWLTKRRAGTHKIITHWRERQYTDFEWEAGDGDVAGYMVFGVSEWEAEAEGAGYYSGGEYVIMRRL